MIAYLKNLFGFKEESFLPIDLRMVFGTPRSGHWPKVRSEHLKKEPICQVCGSKDNLNVHHIQPYHLNPSLELDPDNLITLCEGPPVNCHILFGHFLKWVSFNPNVRVDCATFQKKIKDRP